MATAPGSLAAAFPSKHVSWRAAASGYGGAADGSWTYAIAQALAAEHYTVEAKLHLVKSAERRDGLEMTAYAIYQAHAQLGGYEAALMVRHHDEARHYRVAVSSLWREVILWRPTGGVVQVADFPFEAGKSYTIAVTCRGPHLLVRIDGKLVIDWWDTADPLSGGTVGLGRKEGESYFSSVRVTAEPPPNGAPPRHAPDLRERKWHDGRWFFDRGEPLFVLRDDNVLDHMKLLPGYRAAMYANNFVTDWRRFFPKKITRYQLLESGPRLVIETQSVDPDQPSSITCTSRLEVTYNAARGMYEYNQTCTVDLSAAESDQVAHRWDHGDPVFLGSVGSAETRNPAAVRPRHQWIVFEAPEGTHKIPLNHNGFYAGRSVAGAGPLRPDGGRVIAIGDAVLSPVIVVPRQPPRLKVYRADVCPWGYDVHMLFTPPTVGGVVPVGQYASTLRYTGIRAAEGKKLFAQATLYEPQAAEIRIPVFAAGVGHVESFDKEVVLASPHSEYRLWAGRLDRQVGRGDSSSLRLDGPSESWTILGPSFFMTPYGKRNRISGWVRTRDVQGEGPAIGLRRLDNGQVEFHATRLTGTRDWTPFSYVTDVAEGSFGVSLMLRLSGSGVAWFDDVRVEPVADAAVALSASPLARPTLQPDLVLQWTGKGDTETLLDDSGYGHHGKVHGAARRQEEHGQRLLVLDGKSNYIWPLTSPNLDLGPNGTIIMDVKPEAAGVIVHQGFKFEIRMEGPGPECAVAYQAAGGKAVQSRPFLKAAEWQRLAIVLDKDEVRLYRNGVLADRLAVTPNKSDWSLHHNTTWHRHLSFFGYGPGDMGLIAEPSGGHWKGQLRSLSVWKTALPAAALR